MTYQEFRLIGLITSGLRTHFAYGCFTINGFRSKATTFCFLEKTKQRNNNAKVCTHPETELVDTNLPVESSR